MINYVRYGVELEGPHKGLRTVVLLTARHHHALLVKALLAQRGKPAEHVWVECRPGESYDWRKVHGLVLAGFKVTAQVRTEADLPPIELRGQLSLVWRVPAEFAAVVRSCTHLAVFGDRGTFDGQESAISLRSFDVAEYMADEVWEVEGW